MHYPVISLAAGSLLLAASFWAGNATAKDRSPVVVELFTSQGCHSCPPADALLGQLALRDDVLALAFHVTYWDRLGWPDTLGIEEASERQERYATLLGKRSLYTPQMVIGGVVDVIGSQEDRVRQAIDLVADHAKAGPELELFTDRVEIGVGEQGEAVVLLALFEKTRDVAIERGENRGKTITYHHPVRELIELGRWQGAPLTLRLPALDLTKGLNGAAILVQRRVDGAILSAVRLPGGQG